MSELVDVVWLADAVGRCLCDNDGLSLCARCIPCPCAVEHCARGCCAYIFNIISVFAFEFNQYHISLLPFDCDQCREQSVRERTLI